MDKHLEVMMNNEGLVAAPVTPQMFGNAGREHMRKYGEKKLIFKTLKSWELWKKWTAIFLAPLSHPILKLSVC